jgi:hypothetical protein
VIENGGRKYFSKALMVNQKDMLAQKGLDELKKLSKK